MSQLKALIFDVDGTLAETERDGHRIAFNRAFSDAGLDWHWDENLYAELLAVTGGKERIRFYLQQYKNETITDDLAQLVISLHQSKARHYSKILDSHVIPFRPGVERLIMQARAENLTLAIASTSTLANVSALLSSTLSKQSLSWFDVIAAGDIVPAKKPAPDIYQYCLQQLNLDARDCLAVEDSANGLQAALGAGLKTLVAISAYTYNEDFSGALTVVDHLGEKNRPCKVLAGLPINAKLIDIQVLRKLHAQAAWSTRL